MATEELNKPRSLPPYPEMILRAIEALNEENGSNKTTISKYIESTYGGLPQGHKALLNLHLAKMRDSGQLVFWKNNYTIRDPNAPPRRGRGRPPKAKDPMAPAAAIFSPPKPRGRPPKDPNEPPRPPKATKASGGSGRPRGRPRKTARPSGGLDGPPPSSAVGPSGRPRGRPPKIREISVEM